MGKMDGFMDEWIDIQVSSTFWEFAFCHFSFMKVLH